MKVKAPKPQPKKVVRRTKIITVSKPFKTRTKAIVIGLILAIIAVSGYYIYFRTNLIPKKVKTYYLVYELPNGQKNRGTFKQKIGKYPNIPVIEYQIVQELNKKAGKKVLNKVDVIFVQRID